MPALPPISSVPSLSTAERASILDSLFEPCTQLHTLSVSTLHDITFDSYAALIDAIGKQLGELFQSASTSDTEWLDAILVAHPRLGEKRVGSLSEASRAEQAQLQGGEFEGEKLAKLNAEYERCFPGLRYVVFVNGRSRPVIMEDMQRRIDRADIRQEKLDAIQAMCDIANDRVKKFGS